MLIALESGSVIVGVAGLVLNQVFALWRTELRAKREEKQRAVQDEKASRERRRMVRAIRNLRPDQHCIASGCPLPGPYRDNLRMMPKS